MEIHRQIKQTGKFISIIRGYVVARIGTGEFENLNEIERMKNRAKRGPA